MIDSRGLGRDDRVVDEQRMIIRRNPIQIDAECKMVGNVVAYIDAEANVVINFKTGSTFAAHGLRCLVNRGKRPFPGMGSDSLRHGDTGYSKQND